jgi:hypothetical protein
LNISRAVQSLPGTLQAEDYLAMMGVQTEETDDTGGGLNVGWIEAGDWMEYLVEIPEEGVYTISYRVASESSGGSFKLQYEVEGDYADLNKISFDATGGWQNWISVEDTASLPGGRLRLRLLALSDGFNIKWIRFEEGAPVSIEPLQNMIIRMYPNPASDDVTFDIDGTTRVDYAIYTSTGQHTLSGTLSGKSMVDVSELGSGLYFVELTTEGNSRIMKLLIQ